MFVQDSVRVDRPLATVIDAFEHHVVPQLGRLVRDCWQAELETGGDGAPVPLLVGPRRSRGDGVAYTVAWLADPASALPELDADLELAPLTPVRSHIELSGQCRHSTLVPGSGEERVANRHAMAALAALLAATAAAIERAAPVPTT